MKPRYTLLIVFAFLSLTGFAQVASVEFSGNMNPTVNSTVTYNAVFRNSNGNIITNPPGSGGWDLMSRTLGTVVSSNMYSITINWTNVGSGILEYGFYDEYGNHVSKILTINVLSGNTPPAPVAKSASNITTTSFVANWNASTGATSYTLEVSLTSNFSSIFRTYSGITSLNKAVTSLTPCTTYYYRVRAYTNSNASPNSYVIIGRTVPVAPTGLTTTFVTENSFVANWASAAGDPYRYELDVSNDNFATFLSGYEGKQINGTRLTVVGLAGSTTYKWRVRTVSSTNQKSGNSTVQSVSTLSPSMVDPDITGFSNVTLNSFQVNWISVSGATGYQIDVSENSVFSPIVGSYSSSSTSPSYVVQGLRSGTLYYVRVRAVNGSQTSGYSPPALIHTVYPPPAAPVATGATQVTSQSFKANWEEVSNATSYQVDIATNETFSPVLTTINNIGTNVYTFTGLTERTNYFYRVRAVNSSGVSLNSNTLLAVNFDHNYVRSIDVQVPGKKNISSVDGLTPDEGATRYQYYDGLGRPIQTVLKQGSPLQKDIMVPVGYDGYGRETKKYLPYVDVSESNGWFKENALRDIASTGSDETQYRTGKQYDFYQSGGTLVSDHYPYAETRFEPSPLKRPLEWGAPGAAWQPDETDSYTSMDRTVKFSYEVNAEDEVLLWRYSEPTGSKKFGAINSGNGIQPEYYHANRLFKNKTKDEQHRETIEYLDKKGRVVLKRIQVSDTANPSTTDEDQDVNWASTYYIYDDYDNLVAVLPPEAVKGITGTPSEYLGRPDTEKDAFIGTWAFQYRYDHRSRMTVKKVPGAAPVYMVYDQRDRLVLTQDGRQREAAEWTFTKYDALNRPVSTGTYVHPAASQEAMQAYVDGEAGNNGNAWFESAKGSSGNVHGYDNASFPKVADPDAYHTVTYYDGYGFKSLIAEGNYDYVAGELPGQEASWNTRVKGLVTGTKTRVLGTDGFLWGVTYYDDKYRPVQTVTENYPEGLDRVTNIYNFPGWPMETRLTHQGEETATVHLSFNYDHAGRLLETWHTVNNEDPVLLSKNEYNELGELVKKHLHKEGSTFAQSVDYRYNIRGWLKRINNSDLSPDVGDHRNDLFGMELFYNDGFEKPQYNGNISGARWKNGVDNMERAYGYTYDPMNRLTGADYVAGGTGNWTKEENRFEVGNIGYDHNGNILTLHRNGVFRQLPMEAAEYGVTDQLTYHYRGNQLMAVNDAMDTPQETKNDFKDNGSKGSLQNPEYAYDANGNMVRDDNKGITVEYNHLNLPKKVDFGDDKYIEYVYDAVGTKLQQKVHDGENSIKQTDYVGGMVYEDGQLQFIQHGEGRIVMVDNDGLSKLPEYQYHLKDHLGNVRLTFSANPDTESGTATLEPVHEEEENANFLRYAETTKINSTFFDHTGNGDTHYAVRLNGSSNERIGLAKSLAVMTGDTIKTEVYAKYLDPDQDNWTTALQNLMAAIAAGTAPIGTVIEAVPESGGDGFPFEGLLDAAKANDTGTRAYLNILLFDESLAFLDAAFVPVTAAAKENGTNVPHEKLSQEIVVGQPGYAYIYFSNDNPQPMEVFFDDFTVTHVHSAIVQADDYYPFGLTFNSHQRENSVMNRYLYNGGSEWQDNFGLNWYSTMNRPYDPVLGRFWGIDALSDLMPAISPMVYAYNNPLLFFDPTGLTGIPGCHECPEGIIVGDLTITAPRLPAQDYSFLFMNMANMSNPIYRNIGVQFERGNYDYLSHAFSQRAISYGEGLGYETEFMQGLNSIGEGLTTGLLYASFGAMAAPVIVYGSPYLLNGLSMADRVTGGALTRAGIEGVSQGVVNIVQFGFTRDAVNAIDLADIGVAALSKNFIISSALGASVNFTIGEHTITGPENLRTFTRDFTVGLMAGGQYKGLQKMEINKFWLEVFNGFNTAKAKGLGVASDQVYKK